MRLRAGLAAAFLSLTALTLATPRAECFPLEKLPAEMRPNAEEMLLGLLDSEALFTLVGDLKPISSSWAGTKINVDQPDIREAERLRRILATFRCGPEISANLQPFWRIFDGERYLDAFLFNHRLVSQKVRQHQRFFAFYGLSPSSHPIEVVMAFEVDQSAQRNRGYGYLFGYPKHAVDFFVESEQTSRATGEFVERDFFAVPVHKGDTCHFVWAVPKGQAPTAEDLEIRAKAAPILAHYRRLRSQYIGPGKPGVVQLIRDWFDDGKGQCSPETAYKKVLAGS